MKLSNKKNLDKKFLFFAFLFVIENDWLKDKRCRRENKFLFIRNCMERRKKNIKLSKSFIVYDILFVQDSKNIFFLFFFLLKLISSLVRNDVVVAEMKGIVDTKSLRKCEERSTK